MNCNKPRLHLVLWSLPPVLLLALPVAYAWSRLQGDATGQSLTSASTGEVQQRILGTVPEFELTDRHGRTIRHSDLLGRVWVADFIFTNCAGTCPVMTQRMGELLAELKDVDNVRVVSFSVDPERDKPETLDDYANRHKADDPRWHFLTGDRKTVYGLSREGFRLAVGAVPPEELRPGDEAILHSDRFALVDQRGRVRGLYRGIGPEGGDAIRRLAEDVRRLISDPPP